MSTEVLLEIAENILLCLPPRLRDKYIKLKTELATLDLRSSAPDFGSVELQPLSRSHTADCRRDSRPIYAKENKGVQAPSDPLYYTTSTQSEFPALQISEITPITEVLDEVYLVLRRLRSLIAPTRGNAQEEGPGPLTNVVLASSPGLELGLRQSTANDLFVSILNGCKSILSEAECCSRNFALFSKNMSDSVTVSRVASSTLSGMERENTKLHSIIHERDRQISELHAEAEMYKQVHAELKQQNSVLEHNISVLQERVDGFTRKMADSDRLFKECNAAYLSSLSTLRKEAGRQMAHLSNQLAVTHDRLRRMKGRVEDLSVSGSMLTASILADG